MVCCLRPEKGFFPVTALVTLSAPASDDEGSTAATDGSTLRTSPADHGGSVGSESGGSAVDSVAGEHSGNVPGGPGLLGRGGWGQSRRACLGPEPGFSRGTFNHLLVEERTMYVIPNQDSLKTTMV